MTTQEKKMIMQACDNLTAVVRLITSEPYYLDSKIKDAFYAANSCYLYLSDSLYLYLSGSLYKEEKK